MPAICESISSSISENLSQSFKKAEKENFENHLTPTAKQILSATIEYEPVASYNNSILNSLQTKYIVLQPNQPATSNGNTPKSQQNTNGKLHSATNGTSTSSTNQLPLPKNILFPRENVRVGWQNFGRSWNSGCGFHNNGNTCYLNSTLQAFFHVPALAQWLDSDKDHREKGNCSNYQQCIICAMARTLQQTQRQFSMSPSLITQRLHSICKHLTPGRQEDAHEFLRYLVEQMEKSYLNRFKGQPWFKDLDQYSKETTPLNQILGGYLRSTVTCLSCKHESITFQHFEDLPLDITRAQTLNEALSGYFAREDLEECGYKCESCKKKVSATKKFTLERAPAVLCIQLKRFNVMGGKLSKQIQIVPNLDLQKHLAKSGDPNQSCYYRLTSMVTHLGSSASGGHYTAIGLAQNGGYYHFDDSCVSPISNESVLRTNAYVLFYELVPSKPKHNSIIQNGFYQNDHLYSKSASSTSTLTSRSDADRSFAKPTLPRILPSSIIRQNNQLKQRDNETTPPKVAPSPSKTPGLANGNAKASTQLFPAVKLNGKRQASDDEEETPAKKLKPNLPSLPRLTTEEALSLPLTPSTGSPASLPATPGKPKSLVPYETDDEDEEPSSATNGVGKKPEGDQVKLVRASSGVFVETDVKVSPSKHGSTVDKTVVTKASLTNGKSGLTNGYVKRGDDAITQLTKLNHSGYGSSEVVSWNNTPTSMNREVDKDQQDERKRQHEDDDEMDAGKTKKIKHLNRYHGPHSNSQQKLPNPFQEQQNVQNQNGNGNYRHQPVYYNNDRPNGNGYNRNQNGYQNGQNRYNNKYNKPNFNRNHGNSYHNHKYGGGKYHNGNGKRYDRR